MKCYEFISMVEETAPLHIAAPWDNSGIQVAAVSEEISKVVVALDPTVQNIQTAIDLKANFLLCHHPLITEPRFLNKVNTYHKIIKLLLTHDIWLYSAHTSLDANPYGPVFWLANALQLQNTSLLETTQSLNIKSFLIQSFDNSEPEKLLSICNDNLDILEARLYFNSIRITVLENNFHKIKKDLLIIDPDLIFIPTESEGISKKYGFGCFGTLPKQLNFDEFIERLSALLPKSVWKISGNQPEKINTLAYCPGSGTSLFKQASSLGADIFISGDLKYHTALESNICILDVGHFSLEEVMMQQFYTELSNKISDLEFVYLDSADPFMLVSPNFLSVKN